MEKNMVLTFKSEIDNEETGRDKVEFVTVADFVKKNNKYYVTFTDLDEFETNNIKTTLKIEKDTVTMLRFGEKSSQLVFKEGSKYDSHYETPYGAFSLSVMSNDVTIDIDDNGGNLSLSYDMYFNGLKTQRNDLEINLKETN